MGSGRGSRRVRIGVGLFLIWIVSVRIAEAGSIGRPTASGRTGTLSELNFEYDLVQRDLSTDDLRFQGTATSERVLLEGIYGLSQYSDLYLRAGMADLETSSRGFDGDLGPAIGGGGRWTVYQRGDLKMGVGIQFLEFFSRGGGGPSSSANWTEIESFLGGEIQGIERFIPYFGISFSQVLGRFKGGPAIRADNFIGLFVGAEFHVYNQYYVSSEARIVNENSLTLRLHYRL
jgi:hypothetical protein